jgi:hypothetical protein
MDQLSPRDLLAGAMSATLRSDRYEAERHLDDYAMLRSHGATEPEVSLPWDGEVYKVGGDHFARYVRGMLKMDGEHKTEPAPSVIVVERPKCDCLAHRDCLETKGNPKGGVDASFLSITKFRYSDSSTRHWNGLSGAWIATCRHDCPASVALLAKTGFRLAIA